MKKLILVIMLVVMMTLGLTGMALAATSDTITVTATPAFVGISNSPATWLVNGINGAPAPKVGDGRIRRNIVYYANPLGDVTAPAGDKAMALKYAENTLGAYASNFAIYAARYTAQTFTPTEKCYITEFKTCVYKYQNGGTVKCKIYATDANHKPTGSALSTSDTITPTPTGYEPVPTVTFTFAGDVLLTNNVKYAAVILADTGSAQHHARLQLQVDQAGIDFWHSDDSGATWSPGDDDSVTEHDTLFEVWGESGPLDVDFENVTDAECQFSITNISTVHTDISVNFPDFVGGDAMTNINQDSGDVNVVNGVNAFVAWSWYSGMPYANKILAKATESDILLSDLGETTNKKWGLEIKTQTGAWTVPDSMISSVVVSAEEH